MTCKKLIGKKPRSWTLCTENNPHLIAWTIATHFTNDLKTLSSINLNVRTHHTKPLLYCLQVSSINSVMHLTFVTQKLKIFRVGNSGVETPQQTHTRQILTLWLLQGRTRRICIQPCFFERWEHYLHFTALLSHPYRAGKHWLWYQWDRHWSVQRHLQIAVPHIKLRFGTETVVVSLGSFS